MQIEWIPEDFLGFVNIFFLIKHWIWNHYFSTLNSLLNSLLVWWAKLFVNLFASAILVNQCIKLNMECTGGKINEPNLLG